MSDKLMIVIDNIINTEQNGFVNNSCKLNYLTILSECAIATDIFNNVQNNNINHLTNIINYGR